MNMFPLQKLKDLQEVLLPLRAEFSEAHLYLTETTRKNTASFLLCLAGVIEEVRNTEPGKSAWGTLEILSQQRHRTLFELQVYERTHKTVKPRQELETRDWFYDQLGVLSRRLREAIDELDRIWPLNQS